MLKAQALTPLASSYVTDRRAGCACAYLSLPPQVLHGKKAERAQPEDLPLTRLHADLFVTGTGTRTSRFICHRALTGAYPAPIASPSLHAQRSSAGLVQRVAKNVSDALCRFLRFIFPRIQFGMGINLFRLN